MMAKIQGLERIVKVLQTRAAKASKDSNVSVVVGFTAKYALYVHERIEMKWKGLPRGLGFSIDEDGAVRYPERIKSTGKASGKNRGFYWDPPGRGQAKFLEEPARTLSKELAEITMKAIGAGKTMGQALLLAGYRLQREAQLLCPVDTGNLKASAFTRLEQGQGATE